MAQRTDDTAPGSDIPGQATVAGASRLLDALTAPPAEPDPKVSTPPKKDPPPKGEADEPPEPSFEEELDDLLGLEKPKSKDGEPSDVEPDADVESEDDSPSPDVIEIDGEQVPLAELKQDRLRHADYTRKTQQLADDRKKLEGEAAAERDTLAKAREQYLDGLKVLEGALAGPQEPDWEKVKVEDPDNYLVRKDEWRTQQDALVKVRDRIRSVDAEKQQDAEKAYTALVADEQRKLRAAIPELADPEKGPMLRDQMFKVAQEAYGFTRNELMQVVDHRALLILRDAARFRHILARRQALRSNTAKGKKTLTPGTPKSRADVKRARAKEVVGKFHATRSPRDAAAVIDVLGL
jgi:hypothetical protein